MAYLLEDMSLLNIYLKNIKSWRLNTMSELEIIQTLDKIIAEAEKLKQAITKQFNQSELNSQIDIEELINQDGSGYE